MSSKEQLVLFRVSEDASGKHLTTTPHLIDLAKDGEDILLSIAANCLHMVAKGDGLEGAFEKLSQMVYNKTAIV